MIVSPGLALAIVPRNDPDPASPFVVTTSGVEDRGLTTRPLPLDTTLPVTGDVRVAVIVVVGLSPRVAATLAIVVATSVARLGIVVEVGVNVDCPVMAATVAVAATVDVPAVGVDVFVDTAMGEVRVARTAAVVGMLVTPGVSVTEKVPVGESGGAAVALANSKVALVAVADAMGSAAGGRADNLLDGRRAAPRNRTTNRARLAGRGRMSM